MASEENSVQESSEASASTGGAGEHSRESGEGTGSPGSVPESGSQSREDLSERQAPEGDSQAEVSGFEATAAGAETGSVAEDENAVEGVAEDSPEHSSSVEEPEVLAAEEAVEVLPSAAELAEAREQAERYRDQALRAQAELENVRKRTGRDIENAHKYALEGFVKEILPVRDTLEKGIEAAQKQKSVTDESVGESDPALGRGESASSAVLGAESGAGAGVETGGVETVAGGEGASEKALAAGGDSAIDKIIEGMTLTLDMIDGAMGKHGIEIIDPKGEPFNPEVHQAILEEEREGVASKTVLSVFQKGCLLNGRVVRAAMVVIAK